jgi:hypothetical protein
VGEELIEPATAAEHPRLAFLYVLASECFLRGRLEQGHPVLRAGQIALVNTDEMAGHGYEGLLGNAYLLIGQPQRWVEACEAQLQRRDDTAVRIRSCLVYALTLAGRCDEAMAAANGLLEAAEATSNAALLSGTLLAYGVAFREADPDRAADAFRRGLVVAEESGSRTSELAVGLARIEADNGDTASAFDHATLGLRNYHDSGSATAMRSPLAVVATMFDRLGRVEPAATIAGFALNPMTATLPEFTIAITHLRDVLGDQTYESLAHKGETMTTAEMVTYAYDQIDQARTELNPVSE